MAGVSFLLFFITDFVVSCITAGIVVLALSETKPEIQHGQVEPNMIQALGGYGRVLRDRVL